MQLLSKSTMTSPMGLIVRLLRAVWTGRKEPFGHTRRLEPQPWGAVTRRAVAQRRSRASGLTRRSA